MGCEGDEGRDELRPWAWAQGEAVMMEDCQRSAAAAGASASKQMKQ